MGPTQLPITTMACAMGLNVRVGMEDNVFYRRGELLTSNAQLVERTVRIARELDRRPATPDEARELLGLRGRPPGSCRTAPTRWPERHDRPGRDRPDTRTEGDALMSAAIDSSSLTAVIGAGRMGLGIAESFVMAGLDVRLRRGHARARAELARPPGRAHARRTPTPASSTPTRRCGRVAQVRAADDIADAVGGADLIIECVTEDIGVKEVVLRACDAAARPGAILPATPRR